MRHPTSRHLALPRVLVLGLAGLLLPGIGCQPQVDTAGQPAGACAPGADRPHAAAHVAPSNTARARPRTGPAALALLRAGNARFVHGDMDHPHSAASFRAGLEEGQHPFATIVGCSDSRVPPELIFDEGFGDLFVIRVAGNVVDTDVTASVEYGVDHLHTPLMVVLGHEGCGAVTAAVQHMRGELPEGSEPPEILALLDHIEPGLAHVAAGHPLHDTVHIAVEDNVRTAMAELLQVPDLQRAVAAGRAQVVGAIYDLHSGSVRFLDAPTGGDPGDPGRPANPANPTGHPGHPAQAHR